MKIKFNAPISRLIIKRFRSIPSDSIDFGNPTFFVGRNGSGKSNLSDVFSFLADAMVMPLHAVFDKRGGIASVRNRTSGSSYPPNLGIGVIFNAINEDIQSGRYAFEIRALPNYGFEVVQEQCIVNKKDGTHLFFDRKKGQLRCNVAGVSPSIEKSSLLMPAVGGVAEFSPIFKCLSTMRVYAIEPTKIREMQDPESGVSLRADGSNAASVLQEIERRAPDEVETICSILASIVPNTTKVKSTKHGKKLSLQFQQDWGSKVKLRFEAFNMSDGTLRALGLLMAVYQKPTPSLIAIEEPESTIHPGALGAILDLISHASKKCQVVVTTHSPDLLDASWISEENIRIVSWHEGASHLSQLAAESKGALKDHLMGAGELLRSNALRAEYVPGLFATDTHQPDLFEIMPS